MLGVRGQTVAIVLLTVACAVPVEPGADSGRDASTAGDADAAHVDAGPIDTGLGCASPDVDHDHHDAIACGGDDCDDGDPHRFPANPEVCDATGHDEDCDPTTFGRRDTDHDGHDDALCCNTDTSGAMHCGDDCDDMRASVYAGLVEACDSLDNDCDTSIDEGVLVTYYADCDGDGFGGGAALMLCAPSLCMGHPAVTTNVDCSDMDLNVHPGAVERCNNTDDDCDTSIDEGADATCTPAHGAAATCTAGVCSAPNCDPGYHACGGACPSNGSTATCGTLCTPCPSPANSTPMCDGTTCTFTCNAGCQLVGSTCDVLVPRPIAPLSTSTVTSRRPTLHWSLGALTDGARIDFCRDRSCTTIITTIDAAGTSGAPASDLPTGVVFWRLRGRVGTVTGVATGPTWQFTVGARSAPVDTSWGTTLDVNGDGYADLAVGAPGASSATGRAYVYLGSAAGLATSPATTLSGPDGTFGEFGWSVTSAGDVNGDGYADLAVGAWGGGASNTGRAYVYLGSAAGLATSPATTLTGPDGANGHFGMSVASAGDVNGDGYADLAVGAPAVSSSTGAAYVYLGSATGLATTPATTLTGPDGMFGGFGGPVASAGDVNGDGYADLAVGAYGASSTGRAYVYLGSASGLTTSPATTLTGPDGGNFGESVACAGDVNGDGYADLAVGAYGASSNTGRAYVYVGSASGLVSSPATTLTGPDGPNSDFGGSLASAGDVNGDGYADLAVGAFEVASFTGRAYVYLGSASGLAASPAATLTAPDGAGGQFGDSIASAGDVNGDGYADLAVGASVLSSQTGRAYAYLGSATGLPTSPATTLAAPDTVGQFGYSLY